MNDEKYVHLLGRLTLLEAMLTGVLIPLCKADKNLLPTFEKNVRASLNLGAEVSEGTTESQAEAIRKEALAHADTLFPLLRRVIG
jgi:hypothetical protein